jgi:pimeloyl-ACP methyl ester carboxylesterase
MICQLTLVCLTAVPFCALGADHGPPYITTPYPVTLLSANDGECRFLHTSSGLQQKPVSDSITVIRLGPDQPPVSKTVTGTVPVTIHGSPHVAISANGRYGFVANHGWRDPALPGGKIPPEHLVNVLSVIDLTTDDLQVVDQVKLPAAPWMVDLYPDGKQVVVSVGAALRIYALEDNQLKVKGECAAPSEVFSFDVSPRGDRIIAVTMDAAEKITNLQLHLFSLKGNTITHLQRIEPTAEIGPIDRLFSPRISPDGRTAIVLHDLGVGAKGTLDDVLIVDLDRDVAAVTERIPQVADGLESLAFHPSGRFAVVCCVDGVLDATSLSHLAVIDLTAHPARLLSYTPIELIPEGIEFTADGSELFVGVTTAQHIAVFDVEGFALRRSPFVLRAGQATAALGIGTPLRSFDSNGTEIAYLDFGSGEPVVLLHGGFGSLNDWLRHPICRALLNAGFRVIAMDARGHGQSGKSHDPTAYGAEMADDVVRLLDHLGVAQAHVVGYSMGGDIANKLRERHPARLVSVVLGGVGRYPTNNWAAVDYDILRLADSLERGNGFTDLFIQPLSLGQPAMSRKEAEDISTCCLAHNDPLAIAAMIRGYHALAVPTANLASNAIPTLAIVGEFDPERPDVDDLQTVMTCLEVCVVKGASHFTAAWQPEYTDTVLGFLKRHTRRQ